MPDEPAIPVPATQAPALQAPTFPQTPVEGALPAQPPRPPARSSAALEAEARTAAQHRQMEATEHRSIMRGLLLLALLILLGTLWHVGRARVFVPGWWRQW